jgi:hypothetical protein
MLNKEETEMIVRELNTESTKSENIFSRMLGKFR